MAIPNWVQTGEQCVNYLDKEISKAQAHWELYGAAMATAYSDAYEDQARALDGVKKRIEAKKAADEKLMSFALSLLTVGVGGPVAGALVSRLVAKGGSAIAAGKEEIEAAVKFAEKAGDWAKEKVSEPIKSGTEKLIKHFNPPVDEPFKPAGVAPATYGFKLQEEIKRLEVVKRDLISGLQHSDKITLAGASQLTEQILNSSYYLDMPAGTISDEQLKPKAKLALWIAWALVRDDKYWIRTRSQYPSAAQSAHNDKVWDEQFDWEPVRKTLVLELKIPENQITVWGTDYGWMGRQTPITGLWMWGFMQWASSPQAYRMLFDDNVPTNGDGLEMVKQQWGRRTLGPNGWIETPAPATPPRPTRPVVIPPVLNRPDLIRTPASAPIRPGQPPALPSWMTPTERRA